MQTGPRCPVAEQSHTKRFQRSWQTPACRHGIEAQWRALDGTRQKPITPDDSCCRTNDTRSTRRAPKRTSYTCTCQNTTPGCVKLWGYSSYSGHGGTHVPLTKHHEHTREANSIASIYLGLHSLLSIIMISECCVATIWPIEGCCPSERSSARRDPNKKVWSLLQCCVNSTGFRYGSEESPSSWRWSPTKAFLPG